MNDEAPVTELDKLNHEINKWDSKHAKLTGEKKKWFAKKKEAPVKLYGPYDQTKI